jgi:hypothetical protein
MTIRRVAIVVLLTAAVAYIVASVLTGGGRDAATDEPLAPPPGRVLVVTAGGQLRVLRTSDGTVVETVRDGIEPSLAPAVASPDGRYAYVDSATRCPDGRAVERIDLSSGKTKPVASGRSPTLSHDGDRLAYLAPSDPDDCDVFDTLVVRRLSDGKEKRWPAGPDGWTVTYPHWLPGDRVLKVTLLEPSTYSNRFLDTSEPGGSRLDDMRRVPSLPHDAEPVGYLSGDATLALWEEREGVIALDAVDENGDDRRLATRVNAAIEIGFVDVDLSGEHILWLEREASDRHGRSPAKLMRLTIGATRPVEVADGILSASWLAVDG